MAESGLIKNFDSLRLIGCHFTCHANEQMMPIVVQKRRNSIDWNFISKIQIRSHRYWNQFSRGVKIIMHKILLLKLTNRNNERNRKLHRPHASNVEINRKHTWVGIREHYSSNITFYFNTWDSQLHSMVYLDRICVSCQCNDYSHYYEWITLWESDEVMSLHCNFARKYCVFNNSNTFIQQLQQIAFTKCNCKTRNDVHCVFVAILHLTAAAAGAMRAPIDLASHIPHFKDEIGHIPFLHCILWNRN